MDGGASDMSSVLMKGTIDNFFPLSVWCGGVYFLNTEEECAVPGACPVNK